LRQYLNSAISNKELNRKTVKRLKRMNKRQLDELFHREHERVFQEIDCLDCANCCKTTSPIFKDSDVRRIAKALKVKESAFIDDYLKEDEDGDLVLTVAPCPFLGDDNKCFIYDYRPAACKGYPHTDRKNVAQLMNLTLKNAEICPAVARIFSHLNRLSS